MIVLWLGCVLIFGDRHFGKWGRSLTETGQEALAFGQKLELLVYLTK